MTRVTGPRSSCCMDLESMAWASSGTSSAFFRYSKNGKRCSEKSLGERLLFPTLPSKEGPAWSGRCRRQVHAPSYRTCVVSGLPTNPVRKQRTPIQPWPRDVLALIEHLRLDAADVIGFSMGAGTVARLLMLRPPQVKAAILGGIGDYAIEETILEFPKDWPVPESVPRPLTARVWAEEGARILEQGESFPGTSPRRTS